jgi:hypothetical protein
MKVAELIQNVRQRCGDVNAISPAAEEILTRMIEGMAQDTMQLFTAAASTRTAQKAYFATRATDALKTAKECEKDLDNRLAEMAQLLGHARQQQTMDLN